MEFKYYQYFIYQYININRTASNSVFFQFFSKKSSFYKTPAVRPLTAAAAAAAAAVVPQLAAESQPHTMIKYYKMDLESSKERLKEWEDGKVTR